MDNDVNERVKSTVLEGIGQRKTMFVPMVCISSFMLVGYAALDREAPEIITTSLTMDLSDAQALKDIDYKKIEVVDNRDSEDLIQVFADTDLVDFDRPGEYSIPITAMDSFNNESEPKEITLTLVDNKAPEFVMKNSEDGSFYTEGNVTYVRYFSSGDIDQYVQAIDDDKSSGVDGDLTDLIYQENKLDTSKVGTQFVKASVADNSGNAIEKSFPFHIIDDVKPIIELKQGTNAQVNYGSAFDVTEFINAYDELDGDLNDRVVVEGDEVDTSVFGAIYNIKVKVADNSGNEHEETLTLTVADTEKPKITFSKNNFTVKLKDTINVRDYVSVTDNYDQNIADKVVYSTTSIDTSSTGKKTVTVSATDEAGNKEEVVFTVTVVDPSVYSGNQITSIARSKVGSPYVYGASGPNAFDCSGFTQWVYSRVGISIPRTASTQYGGGTKISFSDLQPGDLLFYNTYGGVSHVGIYVGDGMMVHAGTERTGVVHTSIYSSYWTSRYLGARRYN